ncbi:MAG: uncharacterized protein JWP33_2412 [Blastococcus sp.]|jgi:hypothetical protein|nr:uncharacterized protein [Blastococcus sp.]
MSAVGPVSGSTAAGFGSTAYPPPRPVTYQGSPDGDGKRRRPLDWIDVLTELEGEVVDAEKTMARGHTEEIAGWGRRSEDWVPPSSLGPLPDDLRERAARLLQHQLDVAEALVERITQSQKQRDVAARMSYGPSRPVASYIDKGV